MRAVRRVTQNEVAVAAQEAAHNASPVIVVNHQPAAGTTRVIGATNRTPASLRCEQRVVLLNRNAVPAPEVGAATVGPRPLAVRGLVLLHRDGIATRIVRTWLAIASISSRREVTRTAATRLVLSVHRTSRAKVDSVDRPIIRFGTLRRNGCPTPFGYAGARSSEINTALPAFAYLSEAPAMSATKALMRATSGPSASVLSSRACFTCANSVSASACTSSRDHSPRLMARSRSASCVR